MGKKSKHAVEAHTENDANNSNIETPGKELSYEEKLKFVCTIAKPMASKKFAKKVYKLIKKASKQRMLRHGLKDVQAKLRKGERGLVVFAGDVTPVDIMCHLPIVCEELNVPYIFTPSREDIGMAMGVRRGVLMVMIRKHEDYEEQYEECIAEVNALE